ncbi:hypothetical protein M0802_012309 [Mischocyttarus mexicanus]|nr:hypothetical protein M0802_012309 [Mischocyttarus mexicanus]
MDMEHDMYGGQKRVWNMQRYHRKPVNEYVKKCKITKESWENCFEKLYRKINTNVQEEIITPEEQGHWKFTMELLRMSKEKLNNRKASDSITIPIFKTGEKTDPQSYRGTSILVYISAVMKLFTKILAEVVAKTGISEKQQGYRKNGSITDAIFVLFQIVEKAFNNIRLANVIKILRQRSVDPNITAIIREINTENAFFIKANGDPSKRVHVADGIRQGVIVIVRSNSNYS